MDQRSSQSNRMGDHWTCYASTFTQWQDTNQKNYLQMDPYMTIPRQLSFTGSWLPLPYLQPLTRNTCSPHQIYQPHPISSTTKITNTAHHFLHQICIWSPLVPTLVDGTGSPSQLWCTHPQPLSSKLRPQLLESTNTWVATTILWMADKAMDPVSCHPTSQPWPFTHHDQNGRNSVAPFIGYTAILKQRQ